jgi:hypothetical protein
MVLENKAAEMARHCSGNIILPKGVTGHSCANPTDTFNGGRQIGAGLAREEWKSFHSKWKRYLVRNKIERIAVDWERPQKIDRPSFYCITDPIDTSNRSAKQFCLYVPAELGDKIIVLGGTPE